MSYPFLRKLTFLRSMGLRHFLYKVQGLFVRPRIQFERHLGAFRGTGLEIGGPSAVFRKGGLFPAYETAQRVDNITFSRKTRWEGDVKAGKNFVFHPQKEPGIQFVLEGGGLSSLPEARYDFILSCHMLEHTANPLSVLHEWKRLLKTEGNLLLILPHRDGTFDHRRPVTTLNHLVDDFEKNRGEDDSTHWQEILEMHDIRRDPQQASTADFEKWIRANATNRGAHHHVFDIRVSVQMLTHAGFQISDVVATMPFHIFMLATKLPGYKDVSNERFLRADAEPYRKSPFRSDRLHGRATLTMDSSPSQAV